MTESRFANKAVRVDEAVIELATCPVCHRPITGTAGIAVHLGPIKVEMGQADATSNTVPVNVTQDVTTRLRSLRVRHDCTAPITRESPTKAAPRVLRDEPQA